MAEKKIKKIVRMPQTGKRLMKQETLGKTHTELRELTPETISETIAGIQKGIRENYVFPEQAANLCRSLDAHQANNDYDQITDPRVFCDQLTQHLQNVVNDKHLQVLLPESMPNAILQAKKKTQNGEPPESDFITANILPNNIGYINITMFHSLLASLDRIKAAMQLVAGSSALIIDLRKCRGGNADSINFLLSYFFNSREPLTLLETYFRPQNQTFKCQTTRTPFDYTKRVYVLTSSFTFSGGEHFVFALKIHKRATIVGTRTGGGAHPVAFVGLKTGVLFKVPIGRTYDPETNEDWEGTGVSPDISCSEDRALAEAQKDIQNRLKTEATEKEEKESGQVAD